MMRVYLNGIGLAAAGLMGWEASAAILAGSQPYVFQEMPRLVPARLPPNERRRASPTIKLAMQACEEAMQHSAVQPEEVASVFASSEGDTELMGSICSKLLCESPVLSPFEFHNSVHNAPAGYWAIATGSHGTSTSVCGFDATFAGGLIEAASLAMVEEIPVLFAAYDLPLPPPMNSARAVLAPFAAAFVLTPEATGSDLAILTVKISEEPVPEDRLPDAGLEKLRTGNAAARSLPLLTALAGRHWGRLAIPYLHEGSILLELAAPPPE